MNENNLPVEQWGVYELCLTTLISGNPFLEVKISAIFKHDRAVIEVEGFYDGDENYIVRFMPDMPGEWKYKTKSNISELDEKSGSFQCSKASLNNHGPVSVYNTYHFQYADGTGFFPVGTTCYAWVHQKDSLEEQTLKTLKTSPFNKVRMCVFPKHMEYNNNEPVYYPFVKDENGKWDFTTFNPEFFRHFEKRVRDLNDLGIEADIILFHPYDKGQWGFDSMGRENDANYLKYLISRLAAYKNVWWSLANEYDLLKDKTMDDWDYYFQVVEKQDPYKRLRSVHNWGVNYDYGKPWVTHCSFQTPVTSRGIEEVPSIRSEYKKATIVDECLYEGNIEMRWGNISSEEMIHRFWRGTVAGCYVTHGETFTHPEDILWWSKGGTLHGKSAPRIAFLKKILEEGPPQGIEPITPWKIWRQLTAGIENEYYLLYLSFHQASFVKLQLPGGIKFKVDILDTWEMTVTPKDKLYGGECIIDLPGKPYIALRIRKA